MTRKPSANFHLTYERLAEPPLKNLDALANRWMGRFRRRSVMADGLWRDACAVDALRASYKAMHEGELHKNIVDLRRRVRRRNKPDDSMDIEALAALRELALRKTGLEPYPVQLMGALALCRGNLIEMATGEGKTLTAVLAGILMGWSGKPCHVVTVNDYLAVRDADWHRDLYEKAGLRVASVIGEMESPDRKNAYKADVVYVTSKELLADYLRDRLVIGDLPEGERRHLLQCLKVGGGQRYDRIVMRGIHTAIVDEVDSVLIDEAVTPLILSAPSPNAVLEEACRISVVQTNSMQAGLHYEVDERYREIRLLQAGQSFLEQAAGGLPGIWRGRTRREELAQQALTAKHFYHRDQEFIVEDDKVVIVDPSTGRAMPGRTWRQGLHQIIEAREGLPLTVSTETSARLSFQRFFQLFRRLSGMTGTASESADEFWHLYKLSIVRIPTHRPVMRTILPARYFTSSEDKWQAVAAEAQNFYRLDRPLLIGVRTVAESAIVASLLDASQVPYQRLNAVCHEAEAQKIMQAGHPGQITLATNIAGRGTDIRLGQGVAEMGGLHVLAAQRNESGRIDRQLFGRCARQGDPGTAQVFASTDDFLMKQYVSPAKRKGLVNANEDNPTESRKWGRLLEDAQRRSEKDAFKRREQVLSHDLWIDETLGFGRARF